VSFSYGTKIRDHPTLEDAGEAAIARHSHYYTDVAGWLLRADVVRYSYTVDADLDLYGVTSGQIELWAFPVLRWTQHGATLKDIWSGARQRWVDLRPNAKQWASRTAVDAVAELAERRRRQQYVLSTKLDRTQKDLQLIQSLLEPETKDNIFNG
jgi:hypothetical protein